MDRYIDYGDYPQGSDNGSDIATCANSQNGTGGTGTGISVQSKNGNLVSMDNDTGIRTEPRHGNLVSMDNDTGIRTESKNGNLVSMDNDKGIRTESKVFMQITCKKHLSHQASSCHPIQNGVPEG